jgi:hypothetical protein
MGFKASKFQLVELIVPATAGANGPIYFQNQPQLQSVLGDKRVYVDAIEAYGQNQIASSPLTSGSPTPTNAQILNASLVLNVAGTLEFQLIPLSVLVRLYVDGNAVTNAHADQLFEFEELYQVDWTKSYVQLIAAPGAQVSYLFGVYYHWTDTNGHLI